MDLNRFVCDINFPGQVPRGKRGKRVDSQLATQYFNQRIGRISREVKHQEIVVIPTPPDTISGSFKSYSYITRFRPQEDILTNSPIAARANSPLAPNAVFPQAGDAWDVLESLIGSIEGPSDWASQHDHYLYGTPRR